MSDTTYQQAYRRQMRDIIITKAAMRHHILQNPVILAALNRYIASLRLDARVKNGFISDIDALVEFEHAIHRFAIALHTELNRRWVTEKLDQKIDPNDLTHPISMQNALNNPLHFINRETEALAAIIAESFTVEAMQNEAQFTTELSIQQTQPSASQSDESIATHIHAAEKTATLVDAITVFDEKGAKAAQEFIAKAFHNETGIKTDFMKDEPHETVHNIFEKVLKPKLDTFSKEDEDKRKG